MIVKSGATKGGEVGGAVRAVHRLIRCRQKSRILTVIKAPEAHLQKHDPSGGRSSTAARPPDRKSRGAVQSITEEAR